MDLHAVLLKRFKRGRRGAGGFAALVVDGDGSGLAHRLLLGSGKPAEGDC